MTDDSVSWLTAEEIARRTATPINTVRWNIRMKWEPAEWPRCEKRARAVGGRAWCVRADDYESFLKGLGPEAAK